MNSRAVGVRLVGGAGHLGQQQGRVVREQLAGLQVDDAVAAVEQVGVRVEPVGRDRYLRFGRGQDQRALDTRAGLGPLGRPDHVRGGVAADQGGVDLAGDHFHAPLYMPVGVGCPPGAVPDEPAVPRHDVPEFFSVLVDQAPGETEFGQRLGALPSADLHHGRQGAAAVGLHLVRRMRPHLRRLVASRPGRGRLGGLLAAVAEPAELARRGLVVPAVVEQRVGAELGVDLAVGERRPVGGEHLQPVGVVRIPRGGRVAVPPVLGPAGSSTVRRQTHDGARRRAAAGCPPSRPAR